MPAFRGSCLCGDVAFEVEGPFDRFLNCHCSRCRKASGTAHSCEVIVQASALRWLRGEASVARFDLALTRSFATAFCKRCGGPMPHLTRSGREAIIPAGGFDQPLGTAPDRHAHWSSRADWYVPWRWTACAGLTFRPRLISALTRSSPVPRSLRWPPRPPW